MNRLIYILMILSFTAGAQEDVGVVWMGFSHEWSYNHRLNRLGDYISQPEFDGYDFPVKHYHTGATGLGKDEAYFTSYYMIVKTQSAGFQSGQVDVDLVNKEGERAFVRKTLTIPLEENLRNRDQIVIILNGFDLVAHQGSDKLKMLTIDFGDPVYNADRSAVDVTVEVGFVADCGSFECSRFRQQYHYNMKLQYLLVSGDRNNFFGTEKPFIKSYEWDKKTNFEDGMIDETVKGFPGFNYAAVGFNSLMINMDQDHWLVDWHTSIHPQFYDEKSGTYRFSLDLFLKQWKKSIDSPFKLPSKFAKRKEGWAYLSGSVVLMQFRDACVQSKARFGSVNWSGGNKDADNSNAVNVQRFRVGAGCD